MEIVKLYRTQNGFWLDANKANTPKARGRDNDPRGSGFYGPVTECYAIKDTVVSASGAETDVFFVITGTTHVQVKV